MLPEPLMPLPETAAEAAITNVLAKSGARTFISAGLVVTKPGVIWDSARMGLAIVPVQLRAPEMYRLTRWKVFRQPLPVLICWSA